MNNESSKIQDEKEAREYAFKLLGRRDYTRFGIKTKLEKRNYSEEVISCVMRYLVGAGLVNDKKFALNYAYFRLKRKPRGPRVLEHELFKKGIPQKLIKEVIPGVYDEISEESLAEKVVKKEIGQKKITEKVRQKIYQKFLRLGFSYESIEKVIGVRS